MNFRSTSELKPSLLTRRWFVAVRTAVVSLAASLLQTLPTSSSEWQCSNSSMNVEALLEHGFHLTGCAPQDRREVVAQTWYPTETPGPPVPYFEAQGRLPAYVDPFPALFYGDFDKVDTHASASPPVSAERATWPVLLFLPGWGSPREDYSALCADLASRGYVVVALSHPYESAVSVLAPGRVVGATAGASVLGANMADMTPIRAADSSFVLDQLGRLAQVE